MMTTSMLLPIALTGFGVAFFHAAIPTHWIPFVMAARAQKWTKSKTLAVTALAGAGHVFLTTILGILIVWLGIAVDEKAGNWFPWIAGGVLVLFGLYYLNQQRKGEGHSHGHFSFGHKHHHHEHHDHSNHHHHDHDDHHDHHHHHPLSPVEGRELHAFETAAGVPLSQLGGKKKTSDRVVILGLLAMLTFSPCEGFLPVYLSGIAYGWVGFALLSAILALATLCGMVAFTWLTLAGMERMKLEFLEKYESGLMGAVLCLLGIAVIFFEG